MLIVAMVPHRVFLSVESAADELAHKMGMDPVKFRELNMPMEGEALPGYPDGTDQRQLYHG